MFLQIRSSSNLLTLPFYFLQPSSLSCPCIHLYPVQILWLIIIISALHNLTSLSSLCLCKHMWGNSTIYLLCACRKASMAGAKQTIRRHGLSLYSWLQISTGQIYLLDKSLLDKFPNTFLWYACISIFWVEYPYHLLSKCPILFFLPLNLMMSPHI